MIFILISGLLNKKEEEIQTIKHTKILCFDLDKCMRQFYKNKNMKKIIIGLLLCAAPIFGQQQNNTITVRGEASKKVEIKEYIVNLEIKDLVADGYQNIESKNRSEIIKEYKNKMKSIGIDFKEFKQNKLYGITALTYRTTSYYTYATTSFEEVEKMFGQQMKGVTITWVEIFAKENTNTDLAALDKMAIQDAMNRAKITATGINKKIGAIQKIETSSNKAYSYFNTSKPNELHKHYVQVTFVLE